MRREIVLPAAAWAGGLVGLFLRRAELAAAYDTQTKLMPPCTLTWVLCVLVAALLLALTVGVTAALRDRSRDGLAGAAGRGTLTLAVTAAFLLMAAGALGLWEQSRLYSKSSLTIAACAMCFVAGAAVIAAARQAAHDSRSPRFPILLMAPSLCTLLWLIVNYQQYARQPVLLLYLWQLLSQVAIVLALYFMVSLSLHKGSAARVAAVSLSAIVLTLTSLADLRLGGIGAVTALTDAFALLYLTAQAYLLLCQPHPAKEEIDDER